jgi:hypothetical protein
MSQSLFFLKLNILLAEAEWDLQTIAALEHAASKDGMVRLQLPEHQAFGHNTQPNRSVWTLSTGNGKAALLPEPRAQNCELMDRAAAQALTATEARNRAFVAMRPARPWTCRPVRLRWWWRGWRRAPLRCSMRWNAMRFLPGIVRLSVMTCSIGARSET